MYLAGLVATLTGIGLMLAHQLASAPLASVAGVLFFAGLLALYAVAFSLRDALTAPPGESAWFRTHRAWQRLALGRELRAAVQLLRG